MKKYVLILMIMVMATSVANLFATTRWTPVEKDRAGPTVIGSTVMPWAISVNANLGKNPSGETVKTTLQSFAITLNSSASLTKVSQVRNQHLSSKATESITAAEYLHSWQGGHLILKYPLQHFSLTRASHQILNT